LSWRGGEKRCRAFIAKQKRESLPSKKIALVRDEGKGEKKLLAQGDQGLTIIEKALYTVRKKKEKREATLYGFVYGGERVKGKGRCRTKSAYTHGCTSQLGLQGRRGGRREGGRLPIRGEGGGVSRNTCRKPSILRKKSSMAIKTSEGRRGGQENKLAGKRRKIIGGSHMVFGKRGGELISSKIGRGKGGPEQRSG